MKAEVELWDFGGQPDYNVVHQVFMDRTNAALVVIDESREGAFVSALYWMELLRKRCLEIDGALLVSARTDRTNLSPEVSAARKARELGFKGFLRTSAMTGAGVNEVRASLADIIRWSRLPILTMPARWHAVRDGIRRLAAEARPLVPLSVIETQLSIPKSEHEEMGILLEVLHGEGEVFLLGRRPGDVLVLLHPDVLNRYANSVVLGARTNVHGVGTVDEAAVLRADFDLRGLTRLPPAEERLLLGSVVDLLVDSGACYRENGKLLFPSQRPGRKIKCFLSHNSNDKPLAEDLGRQLLDNGIEIWFDKWEILAGDSLTFKIEEGIDSANAFIILMSPHSMKAKWVKEELRIAIQRRLNDPEFAVIPVLLQDCEIPAFLRDYVYVDWRSPTEETFRFLLDSLRGIRAKPKGNLSRRRLM